MKCKIFEPQVVERVVGPPLPALLSPKYFPVIYQLAGNGFAN